MATFDIPESVKYDYMDLNDLQGMDSWDTNPSEMRASDMLNIVKKEGLHQVRHNINQSYFSGYRKLVNLYLGSYFYYDIENKNGILYLNADLKPDTTYTISFTADYSQNLQLNSDLFVEEQIINVIGNSRIYFTVTTKDTLPEKTSNGYELLYLNDNTSDLSNLKLNVTYKTNSIIDIDVENYFEYLFSIYNTYNSSYNNKEDSSSNRLVYNSTNDYLSIYKYYNYCGYPWKWNLITKNAFGEDVLSTRTINNYKRSKKNPLKISSGVIGFTWTLTSSGSEKCNVIIRKTGSNISIPLDSNDDYYFLLSPTMTYNNTDNGNHSISYSLKIVDNITNVDTGKTYSKTTQIGSINTTITSDTSSLISNFDEYKYIMNDWTGEITVENMEKYTYERTLNYMFTITVDGSSFDVGYDRYSNFVISASVFPTPVDYVDEVFKTEIRNINEFNVTTIRYNGANYITVEQNNIDNEFNKIQIEEGDTLTEYSLPITSDEDDLICNIKYIGKIEEYDDSGNPIPYYIKISEYMGELNKENDSKLIISVWPTPLVKNITYDLTLDQGFEKYKTSYKIFKFTNYGESGNRQGLYEHIEFDGKERVFTPIGILSFNCSTTVTDDGYYQLNFEVENVLDNPYIPTIIYGSTPDGLDYTKYESINLLGDKRKAQFLSDGTSTVYKLPETKLDDYCKVSIMNESGLFEEMTSGFSFNKSNGTVTFTTAPSTSPIDGQDNVIIEYSKKPTADAESNSFTITSTSSDKMVYATAEINKGTDITEEGKIDVNLILSIKTGSSFDKYTCTYNNINISLTSGVNVIYNYTLSSEELTTLKNDGVVNKSIDLLIDNDGSTNSRLWTLKINDTYNQNTTQTITTTQPGSKDSNTSLATQSPSCLGFSWIGLKYNASAVATVGSKTDGSDSYWTVTESVQLWVSKASYLNTAASSLYGVIDGVKILAGSTGAMYATSTIYPSSMLSVSRKIAYSSTKKSVSIGAYMKFGTTTNLSGTNYTEMSTGSSTLNLPTITLPKTVTTTTGANVSGSGTSSTTYTEIIMTSTSKLNYGNVVPGSARLACYYGAKCVAVYGYESDRRVFVSDGTNTDTFSGVTLDGTSSIYYFPDDNYRVLGEDTETLGYALKDGYLLTFKRGDDSVYVRYATTLNDVTEFPSSAVTRNLQVLARPIQINDEILIITREGIESVSYTSQEVRTNLRSYFINNYFQLSSDYNYDKMSWYKEDNLLHIYLGDYEFTCDLVAKSYVREGTGATSVRYTSTLQYQYEWFVSKINWDIHENPPVMTVYQPRDFERATSGIVYENQRAIGYNNNGIYEYSYNDYKVDKFIRRNQDNVLETLRKPIKAHYITPFLNMGVINVAKTVKYVYVNTRSKNGDMFAIGYIDENGYQETLEKVYNNIKDYNTKLRNSEIPFPKLIQIKSKIRKFMNIKLYIQNRAELENVDTINSLDESLYGNTTFDRILIQYQIAGKYRGE